MQIPLRPEPGPPGLRANLIWRLRAISRRRLIGFGSLAAAALLVAWSILAARTAAAELGERRQVVVVQRAVSAGDSLDDAVSVVAVPVAMVPDDAVATTDELGPGVVATTDLAPGEVLRLARTSAGGRFGLGPDERAVTIPLPLAPGPLAIGQRVEVIGIQALGDGGPAVAATLAADVEVVDISEDGLTLVVPRPLAGDIYRTAAVGAVEVAIRSG